MVQAVKELHSEIRKDISGKSVKLRAGLGEDAVDECFPCLDDAVAALLKRVRESAGRVRSASISLPLTDLEGIKIDADLTKMTPRLSGPNFKKPIPNRIKGGYRLRQWSGFYNMVIEGTQDDKGLLSNRIGSVAFYPPDLESSMPRVTVNCSLICQDKTSANKEDLLDLMGNARQRTHEVIGALLAGRVR